MTTNAKHRKPDSLVPPELPSATRGAFIPMCQRAPQSWDSIDLMDHMTAASFCDSCPLTAHCLSTARRTINARGTWGGVLFIDGEPVADRGHADAAL